MSKLRSYLRSMSEDLADAADDLWRRSAPIHEKQNNPNSLTQNGGRHVKAVELGIWRLLNSTTSSTKKNNLDLFDNAFPIFILSAAACCHDFDKATDLENFQHGERSADLIEKNQKDLGLDRIQRVSIQNAIRIHNLNGKEFVKELNKLSTEEAGAEGVYNLQLIAVLLKASDILHCDNSRISVIDIKDPKALKGLERLKYLSRSAVKGWRINGNKIEFDIMPNSNEEFNALNDSFEYMKKNEWPAVKSVLQYKEFPYNLTKPELLSSKIKKRTKIHPGKQRRGKAPTQETDGRVHKKQEITLKEYIEILSPPFKNDYLPKPSTNDFKFPEDVAFVNRIGPNCRFGRSVRRLLSKSDILVLSGPQQTGKTWVVRRIIDLIKKQSDQFSAFYICVSEKEIYDIIHDVADLADKPEYIIYALWCHNLLWKIPGLPDEYKSDHKYASYRFNGLKLVKDIAEIKKEYPEKSVFKIITKIIEDALIDAGLNEQDIVIFFESKGIHNIEAAYPLEQQVKRTKSAFQEELIYLRKEPLGHRPGRVKAIISTRPFEFKEIEYKRPVQTTDVYQSIEAFNKEECDAFIDSYQEEIKESINSENRFEDENVIEIIKKHSYEATNGYPFFFNRWVRSFLFIALNSAKESCHEIIDFIEKENVFWYYKNPFTKNFKIYLKDSRITPYAHSQDPIECSKFLNEVLKHFIKKPSRMPEVMDLFSTYCRRIKYSFYNDKRPLPLYLPDNVQFDMSHRITDVEREHALSLARLGLVTFKGRSHDGRFLHATNSIIERFFDPYAIAEWMDVEIKEESLG